MAVVERQLSLSDLCKEYNLVFRKVHLIQMARMQAEVDRLEWMNRYREWMIGQKDPPEVSGNNADQLAASIQVRDHAMKLLVDRFTAIDPYPHMPEPDLAAEKRMAELHHLIAKAQRDQSE
jgi:hypothetical protein